MKLLSRACCICTLALTATACSTVPRLEESLRSIDLGAETYVVRAGDTLETIAFRYRLSPNELAALNPGKGRRFAPGTALNVRSVSRSGGTYRTESVDAAFTSPVDTPRAVPERAGSQSGNRSIVTPALNAVVSDVTLLGAGKPTMRQGALEDDTAYAPREVIEEEYTGGRDTLDSADVSEQLQPMVGRWIWPTQGQVARGFSPTEEGRHGVDIAGLPGQPVVAVMDGTVAYSGKDPSGSGNLVIIRHDDSLLSAYSHTKDLYVAEDDTVRAGDPIGTLGWNAQQESVLRFEVRRDGNSLNPMDFLSAR
ncbi:MAG: peptidoglycan DD-metalloendopeptidase family protein [Granulosicoccus sp.]|nr:peptidoglycan DD-metalloendopeptidase family protein [Granulosicoccus sp.]